MHQAVKATAARVRIDCQRKLAIDRLRRTQFRGRWVLFAMLLATVALTVYEIATDATILEQQESPLTRPPKPAPVTDITVKRMYDELIDGDINDYKCVAWRQTVNCSSDGEREPENDRACDTNIPQRSSGYCEIQHKVTGALRRVLPLECLSANIEITCDSFVLLTNYGANSTRYTHDPKASFEGNRHDLVTTNKLAANAIAKYAHGNKDAYFSRGIAIVIYEKMLPSAYASIVMMRKKGCMLPVEIFYCRSEVEPTHPILKELVESHSVYLREIKDPEATGFYTKLYAVFYSAFDQVLFLDADNFATKDPTYLFDTAEFKSTGAMFWPDFWHPVNTIFQLYRESIIWRVFDIPFVDMFEQESGQILINRRVHMKAMNVLMYYGFNLPRIHQDFKMVWGDKDLFRLAWMKTNSTFHMIARPPGEAGMLNKENNRFCGVTMAQHDPSNELIFLHRNWEKLVVRNLHVAWTHVQQYKLDSPLKEYHIRASNVVKELDNGCWGADENWEKLYTVRPMSDFHFHDIETDLLRLVKEAYVLANVSASTVYHR